MIADHQNIDNKAALIFCSPSLGLVKNWDRGVAVNSYSQSSITHPVPQFLGEHEVSQTLLQDILRLGLNNLGFKLDDPSEIIDFVLTNTELLKVLSEAKYEVEKYFPNSELHLSFYKDIEEDFELLSIQILHNVDFSLALEKENELFDKWFERHYIETNGKLTLRAYHI